MTWDPYKDCIGAHPLMEVLFYSDLLISYDVAEAYYPNLILRQFGQVQRISSMPMIKPLKQIREKTTNGYKWYIKHLAVRELEQSCAKPGITFHTSSISLGM